MNRDYKEIWGELNNAGDGFAPCDCDGTRCGCDINELEGLGVLIQRTNNDRDMAVYQDGLGVITIVGNAHGPWAVAAYEEELA